MTRDEILKVIEQAAAEGWTELDLSQKGLTEIPEEISQLSNLTTLNLNGNQIKEIPRAIAQLANLTSLNLKFNQIKEIPEAIAQLANLKELNLSKNQIKEIPDAIAQLHNLGILDVSHNQISCIPESITRLPNLTDLVLYVNQIKSIPIVIFQLKNLQYLVLSNNKINNIPKTVSQLENLQELYLSFNHITTVPEELFLLKNLQEIHLSGNQIPQIPKEVIHSNNAQKIFNYLQQIGINGTRPLHEAKMLLVGQGSVGKTSLIERLINNIYNCNQSQTDGLNVKNWQIDIGDKNIRLNVWDFGGQEIYHATHQFFLTKRSLYLLVCNCRTSEEENRIEYWLKLIQTFGDASPVIIVGNKKDEQPFDINQKALREKYPNIQAIIETSCQTNDGIEDLRKAIYAQVANLKEVYDLLPLSWFEVKEKLEAMTEDFITYNHYLGICHEHKIPEEKNQEQLIDLLHRLGLVLNFREHPILQNTNVLKPDWATEGIYTLLSDETLKTENKGIFTPADLSRILDGQRYPTDKHHYLIELMKEFELCFALDCYPPRFLIPAILPKDEPEDTNLRGETLEFQYHYRVLPESIISRFIVKSHEKIHENIWWRSGVMLEYKEGAEVCNIARIKADPEDKKIFITINGKPETRRIFLCILREVFNKIHHTFANPEITEWVPVPNHPDHPPLDYQELIGLEAMGETHVTIGKLRLKLELRQLLDGYESRESRQKENRREFDVDIDDDSPYNISVTVKDQRTKNIHQHGEGDNFAGNRIDGDKIE